VQSRSTVASLEYVDDYGDPVEDTSAVALLARSQQEIATAAMVARALGATLEYVYSLQWREWIDHALAAKAITWRMPSRSQSDKYL
jgi:hypothetical protein